MGDITLSSIAFVKIILDFQPSSVDPSWIRNLLYPFNPICHVLILTYTYITHFVNMSWLSVIALKDYGHFGIAHWLKIRIFWSKPLNIECALKSRVQIDFRSNFQMILIMMIQRS